MISLITCRICRFSCLHSMDVPLSGYTDIFWECYCNVYPNIIKKSNLICEKFQLGNKRSDELLFSENLFNWLKSIFYTGIEIK